MFSVQNFSLHSQNLEAWHFSKVLSSFTLYVFQVTEPTKESVDKGGRGETLLSADGKPKANIYRAVTHDSAPDGSWTSATEYYEAVSCSFYWTSISVRVV